MFGIHISAGALAAALGFLVLWPRTMKEGFARLFCTIVASSVFGPILVVYLHSNRPSCSSPPRWWPGSTNWSQRSACCSAPLLVIAGLPAWWLIGAALRRLSGTAIHGWARSSVGKTQTGEQLMALQPRGIRNNNPGNIVWSARNNWQGQLRTTRRSSPIRPLRHRA
nr:hypothetical protein [Pseudomonas aeruginosa]